MEELAEFYQDFLRWLSNAEDKLSLMEEQWLKDEEEEEEKNETQQAKRTQRRRQVRTVKRSPEKYAFTEPRNQNVVTSCLVCKKHHVMILCGWNASLLSQSICI